jgi:hypothetical protein
VNREGASLQERFKDAEQICWYLEDNEFAEKAIYPYGFIGFFNI